MRDYDIAYQKEYGIIRNMMTEHFKYTTDGRR